MRRWSAGVALAAVFAWACATTPQAPVPVLGASEDLGALRGRWVGEYSSSVTGRSGTVVFDLEAAGDTAHGEVWMSIGERTYAGGAYTPEAASGYFRANERVEVLTIRFVRVDGGTLSGVLDPYRDPLTGIELLTVFRGSLEGDVITGEFASTNAATGDVGTGRWRVERKPVKAQEEKP
jgi:hypothetical protein